MPARMVYDEPDDVYYSNANATTPLLSQSLAKTLLTKSPAHAWVEHPQLGGKGKKATPAMDEGTVLHSIILGAGKPVEVVDAKDWRTKATQEARDAAQKAGKVAFLAKDYAELQAAATECQKALAKVGVRFNGKSEVSLYWTEETPHGPVECRGRLDHWHERAWTAIDLKKTVSASPSDIGRKILDLGIDLQWAAYTSALRQIDPSKTPDMLFAFCEVGPPYAATAVIAGTRWRETGETRWRRACEIWAKCCAEQHWPAYAADLVELDLPEWAYRRQSMEVD